ncbi:immunodominant staphylococcal antigen IsaB family protein [Macrococcus animalis]|uniref:immunodominant staphylococcal antigen IsaB family protein n=1 Tax=Macrococcus animalis TaxID=3395467 RepID=UPI0039BDE33E
MKRLKLALMALIVFVSVISFSSPANAAGYYYKYKGYSGNNYQFVTSKSFVNAVKKGKVTVNNYTVVNKVSEQSLQKSSQVMLTYALENKKVKSKYIKRKYDTDIFLNDNLKVYSIIMPVKKGKITKNQFIKTYGKNYSEAQIIENEFSVYYKFKNHYFEGVFNKKNQLIGISFSSHLSGQFGKDLDEMLFSE